MRKNLLKRKKYNMYNTPPHFNVYLLSDECQSYVKAAQKYFLAMILWISSPNYRLIWFDKHLSNHSSVNHVLRRTSARCAWFCHIWYILLWFEQCMQYYLRISPSDFLWLTRDRISLRCVGSWILTIHILIQHHKGQLIRHDLMMLLSMFALSIVMKLQCRHM
jgi:hypothetical protein